MDKAPIERHTRTGLDLAIRPVTDADHEVIKDFFDHVTPEDLRFRYLVGIDHVSDARIAELTDVDHDHVETYLAFSQHGGTLLAIGTLACDAGFERAEVAIMVHQDFKSLGIAWELLSQMTFAASERGVKVLESLDKRDNHPAIDLERDMGFVTRPDPDDSTLLVAEKALA